MDLLDFVLDKKVELQQRYKKFKENTEQKRMLMHSILVLKTIIDAYKESSRVEPDVINFGGHISTINGAKENNYILINEDEKVMGVYEENKFYGSHKYGLTTSDLIDVIEIMKNAGNTGEDETG
jgi:hypothetical protein